MLLRLHFEPFTQDLSCKCHSGSDCTGVAGAAAAVSAAATIAASDFNIDIAVLASEAAAEAVSGEIEAAEHVCLNKLA